MWFDCWNFYRTVLQLLTLFFQGRSAFEPPQETTDADFETASVNADSNGLIVTYDNTVASGELSGSQRGSDIPPSQLESTNGTGVYQQQYDSRGHPMYPASKERARQSRRAMNDVLATVGVIIGKDSNNGIHTLDRRRKPTFDAAKVGAVSTENSHGFIIETSDLALITLSDFVIVGLRQRLQVSTVERTLLPWGSLQIRAFGSTLEYQ